MSASLDELYFEWLYEQICSVKLKNPSRTYWNIFRMLFKHEFVWFVPNDDNRVTDGQDLRVEFLHANRFSIFDTDPDWLNMGCSMLEMFIGLSRVAGFETGAPEAEWFWEIMENLNLRQYNDRAHIPEEDVWDTLNRVIWRTYRTTGKGGMFPLRRPRNDQRDVELWYQLSAYILERN